MNGITHRELKELEARAYAANESHAPLLSLCLSYIEDLLGEVYDLRRQVRYLESITPDVALARQQKEILHSVAKANEIARDMIRSAQRAARKDDNDDGGPVEQRG
jgi:hypothetical protein